MSMAIITQTEANTIPGGSAQGFLSGSDTTSATDTFYGRRLTDMWVNESFSGTPTVNTFTASSGGAGAASTEGTFTLVPGTYRITIDAEYIFGGVSASVIFGLYNVTSAAFEVYSGTSEPVIGIVISSASASTTNGLITRLHAIVTVASTNKTFAVRHKASSTTVARATSFCGTATGMTGTNVNGAAAKNTYCIVKIVRTA